MTAGGPDALALHRDALVVDGHNDLPWRIREEGGLDLEGVELDRADPRFHTDLDRLAAGGVDIQFWAAYLPVAYVGGEATRIALEQIDLIRRFTERYPKRLGLARSAAEARAIVASGRTASMIGVEGGHAISGSLSALHLLYAAGARYLTLTHIASLAWVDAAGDVRRAGGLSSFGEDVVREMNRLWMLVDLSHVSDEAMEAALRVSAAPVIFSHSSARAVADHPRNIPDDVLRRLAANGGVAMVNFFPGFLTPGGTQRVAELFEEEERIRLEQAEPEVRRQALEDWAATLGPDRGDVAAVADHIDHIAGVAGVEHVGLGSDFDGIPATPAGLEDVSCFPRLTVELVRRGYGEAEIRGILGENFMRTLAAAERVAEELSGEAALPAGDSRTAEASSSAEARPAAEESPGSGEPRSAD